MLISALLPTLRQTEDQSTASWHSVITQAVARAYPEWTTATALAVNMGIETNAIAISYFLEGLYDDDVVHEVRGKRARTMTEALEVASDAQATINKRRTGRGVPTKRVLAMDSRTPRGPPAKKFEGTCFYCNIKGHQKRDCRKLLADKERGLTTNGGRDRSGRSGRGGRNNGRSGRGRGSGSSGSGGRAQPEKGPALNRATVSAIDELINKRFEMLTNLKSEETALN